MSRIECILYSCALDFVSVPFLCFFEWSKKFSFWILDEVNVNGGGALHDIAEIFGVTSIVLRVDKVCWRIASWHFRRENNIQQSNSSINCHLEFASKFHQVSSSKIQQENLLLHVKNNRMGTETKTNAHQYIRYTF